MNGLWLSLVCGPLLLGAAGEPQPPAAQALSLADVLDTVRQRHPYAAVAATKVESARGKRLAASAVYNPEWVVKGLWVPDGAYEYAALNTYIRQTTPLWGTRLLAGYRRTEGTLPVYKGDQFTLGRGVVWGGIEVPLLKGGLLDRGRADLQVADTYIDSATAELHEVWLRLRREATEAYWSWAAANCRRRIEDNLLNMAQSRTSSLEAMVRHGEVPQIELIENQRAILGRQERVLVAERKLQETAIKLSLYLRDARDAPVLASAAQAPAELPPLLPPPAQLGQDVETARTQRPELRRLQAQQQATAVELQLAENSVLPKLDIMVGAARNLENAKKTTAALEAGVQFSMPLPLREGRGKRQDVSAQTQRLESEMVFLRDKIGTEVADVYSKLNNAYARFGLSQLELTAAQTVERAEKERFRLGDSSLLIVNLREQATADTAKRQLDTHLEYLNAWGEYRAVTAEAF